MSFLDDLASGAFKGIFDGIAAIIAKFKADPETVLKHGEFLAQIDAEFNKAQLAAEVAALQAQAKINDLEAQNNDKFVSRWRPAAGWLGVIGLAYSVLAYPLLTWASVNFGWNTPPPLDTSVLVTLLMGMLGLGGMRTYEKTTVKK